jgi:hypothetical protein
LRKHEKANEKECGISLTIFRKLISLATEFTDLGKFFTHPIYILNIRRILHTNHIWTETHNTPILSMQRNMDIMSMATPDPEKPWKIGPSSEPWAGNV